MDKIADDTDYIRSLAQNYGIEIDLDLFLELLLLLKLAFPKNRADTMKDCKNALLDSVELLVMLSKVCAKNREISISATIKGIKNTIELKDNDVVYCLYFATDGYITNTRHEEYQRKFNLKPKVYTPNISESKKAELVSNGVRVNELYTESELDQIVEYERYMANSVEHVMKQIGLNNIIRRLVKTLRDKGFFSPDKPYPTTNELSFLYDILCRLDIIEPNQRTKQEKYQYIKQCLRTPVH